MKLHILSDLHFEFGRWPKHIDVAEADVIVLAGDIGVGLQGLEWALGLPRPVVYVFGNHEFYGYRTMKRLWEKVRTKVAGTHVRVLENETVTLPDPSIPGKQVRFIGATLWTDFELFGADRRDEAMQFAELRMNDYQRIHLSNRTRTLEDGLLRMRYRYDMLTPKATQDMHQESRRFIEQELSEPGTPMTKSVVVTHHAPSAISLRDGDGVSMFDPVYASKLDNLAVQPDLWVHGHTHVSKDYAINGQGRIVCNPRGYAKKGEVATFNPRLVVEI